MAGLHVQLETPSRIWRRIQEAEEGEMPSLPSLPAFEQSTSDNEDTHEDELSRSLHLKEQIFTPIQSTPTTAYHSARPPSSTSSTARFAASISARSRPTSGTTGTGSSVTRLGGSIGHGHDKSSASRRSRDESFDISAIPHIMEEGSDRASDFDQLEEHGEEQIGEQWNPKRSRESVGEDYLPPDEDGEDELSLTDALESVSRASSPALPGPTPRKKAYDYSISLRSEGLPSPIDAMKNVSIRRGPPVPGSRTPSLSHTASPPSSSAASTPRSAQSVPLPESPEEHAEYDDEYNASEDLDLPPMDETHDPHVLSQIVEEDEELSQSELSQSQRSQPQAHSRRSTNTEATFSSSDEPASLRNLGRSPTPSVVATPTPAAYRAAAAPRTPFAPTPFAHAMRNMGPEDPATPAIRKTSFLMSVVNSTTRPRLTYQPTPHPQGRTAQKDRTQALAGVTPGPGLGPTSAPSTGSTIRRTRLSFGGAQSRTFVSAHTPEDEPFDPNASYVSTASSHDLTSHANAQRANASFDPSTVRTAGAASGALGRFNAAKLNAYLHSLNRKLQDENEQLVQQLAMYEERVGAIPEAEGEPTTSASLSSAKKGRRSSRASFGVTPMAGLTEDVSAEDWIEERRALEELIEELRAEVAQKSEVEAVLEEEQSARENDRQRFKERMVEVETGVEKIIAGVELERDEANKRAKLADDRAKVANEQVDALEEAIDEVQKRAEKAEAMLESGQALGGELREANDRIAALTADLRTAQGEIKSLEGAVIEGETRQDELERSLKDQRQLLAHAKDELAKTQDEAQALEDEKGQLQDEIQRTVAAFEGLQTEHQETEKRNAELESHLLAVEQQLRDNAAECSSLKMRVEEFEHDGAKAEENLQRLMATISNNETKIEADAQDLADLQAKVGSLERQLERERERSRMSVSASQSQFRSGPAADVELQAQVEGLELELDEAYKEIAKLTAQVAQSPTRKTIQQAKDDRIAVLEDEKQALADRLKALRGTSEERENATPGKAFNLSGMSPMHRQLLSIRLPKTPGGPLQDMSWLINTPGNQTVAPLIAEIQRLQHELDIANESVDGKIDQLEEAGLGFVGLTRKLSDARAKIAALEAEIERLSKKDERRTRRMSKMRCTKCLTKFKVAPEAEFGADDSIFSVDQPSELPSSPPTPPSKTTNALKANLDALNAELEAMKKAWADERRQYAGEKAVLQDAAHRLNAEIRTAKQDTKKATNQAQTQAVGLQADLERAKRNVEELEAQLGAERAEIRFLTTDQERGNKKVKDVVVQLQRTEADMEDVRAQLAKAKKQNQQLGDELRANSNVEEKARKLEAKVIDNQEAIDRLRHERSSLESDHRKLQNKYSGASEEVNRLTEKHAALQASYDSRRMQLDMQVAEIDELRTALGRATESKHRHQQEKERETEDAIRDVARLQAELERVRADALALGRDLSKFRNDKQKYEEEREKAERAKKQAQSQIRLLREEVDRQTERARKAEVSGLDEKALAALKVQHKQECKGLIVQIRYLKAKFTRESSLRQGLGYQKSYLLILLGSFERSEKRIVAAIARIGFPVVDKPGHPAAHKRRSLKSVVQVVIFVSRARAASDFWRQQSASKRAVADALQDVRQRRAVQDS